MKSLLCPTDRTEQPPEPGHRHRVVAIDCLVAIGGSRYSVPARFVGESVLDSRAARELRDQWEAGQKALAPAPRAFR